MRTEKQTRRHAGRAMRVTNVKQATGRQNSKQAGKHEAWHRDSLARNHPRKNAGWHRFRLVGRETEEKGCHRVRLVGR